jgi:tripeptidyl-peptidase I
MFFSQLTACALGAALSVNALPKTARSDYAVKERHAVPGAWTAVGDAPKSEVINLHIGLKQRNEGVIEQHLLEVSDPNHARYGEHLTADEVNSIVAPADESIDLVHEWLLEHGVTNFGYSPAKDWISIVTTIEKVEELLQTKYSKYRHHDGSTVSRAQEWSLPLYLHEHIEIAQPTNSFFKPKPNVNDFGNVQPKLDDAKYSTSWWEKTGKHLYGGHGVRGLPE